MVGMIFVTYSDTNAENVRRRRCHIGTVRLFKRPIIPNQPDLPSASLTWDRRVIFEWDDTSPVGSCLCTGRPRSDQACPCGTKLVEQYKRVLAGNRKAGENKTTRRLK